LEERQSGAIAYLEETMTIAAHCTKQLVGLALGCNQWQPQNLLVELSCGFELSGDVGVVMQSAGYVSLSLIIAPLGYGPETGEKLLAVKVRIR
jgi:hypothetical protein